MDDETMFVPVLTILPEFGGPFIWMVERADQTGVGPCLCDSMGWDESMPLSEGLFLKFWDWTFALDQTEHMFDGFGKNWDWPAYHARGLHLACWLKNEVGTAYRVVYYKSTHDPNWRLNTRTEVLIDGSLEPSGPTPPDHNRFCQHIISGGQTGADRAALDFAIESNITHGGLCPLGRKSEDGRIPSKYQLRETASSGYRQRTRQNVRDSDGTLIVNTGALDGGTLATRTFTEKEGKPCFVAQVDADDPERTATEIIEWLREHAIHTLNVAGPRTGKRPGIHELTYKLLQTLDALYPKRT